MLDMEKGGGGSGIENELLTMMKTYTCVITYMCYSEISYCLHNVGHHQKIGKIMCQIVPIDLQDVRGLAIWTSHKGLYVYWFNYIYEYYA